MNLDPRVFERLQKWGVPCPLRLVELATRDLATVWDDPSLELLGRALTMFKAGKFPKNGLGLIGCEAERVLAILVRLFCSARLEHTFGRMPADSILSWIDWPSLAKTIRAEGFKQSDTTRERLDRAKWVPFLVIAGLGEDSGRPGGLADDELIDLLRSRWEGEVARPVLWSCTVETTAFELQQRYHRVPLGKVVGPVGGPLAITLVDIPG